MATKHAPHGSASIALSRILDSRLNVRLLMAHQQSLDAEETALLQEGERLIMDVGRNLLGWMARVQAHNKREDELSHAALAQAVEDLTGAAAQVQAALTDVHEQWAVDLAAKIDVLMARAAPVAPRRNWRAVAAQQAALV